MELLPVIDHHGMSVKWFDAALHRAMMSGKTARRIAPGQWVTSSVTQPGLSYLTTKRECSCPGHRQFGRCCCRALVIFEEMMIAEAARTPQSAA